MIKSTKKKIEKFRCEIGEKILCYQGPHLYEAKCLSIRKASSLTEYLIHYRGWKPKYDEWVPANRILKYNEENLQLQQQLRECSKEKFKKSKKEKNKHSLTNKNKLSKREEKPKKPDNGTNNNTNITNNNSDVEVPMFVEKQEDFLNKRELKIRIPENLKTILTDDWTLIINQKKLVHLPFKLNIDRILNDYYLNKTRSTKLPSNHSISGYVDFLSSIRRYFNYFLDKCLLYPSEKQQMEFLIQNYDEFISMLNKDPNSNKDSRRLWKKFKRSNGKNSDLEIKLSSVLNEENDASKTKSKLFIDQNSQSETSDSCTSTEISATELNTNTQNQIANSIIKEDKDDNHNDGKIFRTNNKRIDFTKLYGAVHLLRLFTKLGQFIFYSDLNTERLALLNSYIDDFLKYLSKNLWLFDKDESDTSYVNANFINFSSS